MTEVKGVKLLSKCVDTDYPKRKRDIQVKGLMPFFCF